MQGMKIIHAMLVLGIVGTTTISTAAAPVVSRCSPIIPVENCRDALSEEGARNLITDTISPSISGTLTIVEGLMNNVSLVNISTVDSGPYGPYRLDNSDDRRCAHDSRMNASDCIARSVYRFKCEVPVVADTVKTESIRKLVLEQSNFATEFKEILDGLEVLFDLKELISRYQPLNSCTVPEDSCPHFNTTGLDRLVVIRAITDDLFHFLTDLRRAIEEWYSPH